MPEFLCEFWWLSSLLSVPGWLHLQHKWFTQSSSASTANKSFAHPGKGLDTELWVQSLNPVVYFNHITPGVNSASQTAGFVLAGSMQQHCPALLRLLQSQTGI